MRVTLFHTGFSIYTIGLANALSALADVTVVQPEALSDATSQLANGNFDVVKFPKPKYRRSLKNIPAMLDAFNLIKASRPDAVHVQETFDYGYDLVSAFKTIPNLVTTIHDVAPHPGDGDAAPGLRYSKYFGIKKSKRLIVHTAGMKDSLSARFRVSKNVIDVIPHGELGSLYRSIARKARIAPVERDEFTLLFFGRIWEYKGLRYLLEAFPMVKASIPQARLLICGRGGDLDEYLPQISNMSGVTVESRYIPDSDVAGIFERSSLVVLPYIEASQSGVSALGFTSGAVVVATKVGGLAEQLRDQETAVLVAPRDAPGLALAIIEILKNKVKQEEIRKEANRYGMADLSWELIARKSLSTYRSAVGA